jgi:carboxyl-terminal processing protease
MSLRVRSILVLVVGTVLGLTVALGSTLLAERDPHPVAAADELPPQYVELLTEAMQRVRREYVDQVDDRTLIEGAIRGMIQELDPHSRYLDASQFEDIRITTTGNYSGVGLDISLEEGRVTVVTPLDGAPAAQAGIRPGDVVVSVDAVPVDDDNVEDTVNRMRGHPGTEVTLGVSRDGRDEILNFALTRAQIQVRTVRGEHLGDGFGYLRLTGFSDTTAAELDAEARRLRSDAARELRGLVLDLRNNPGGVLDAAVAVADEFLDSGLIVRGSGRIRQARFERHAEAGDSLENVPLVILVNAGSASGSEIVAAALKDHRRAMLVGERTYGKGSVQSVVPLGRGGAIKLTTSRYITPSGVSINGIGIKPDYVVRNDDPNVQYRGSGGHVDLDADAQLKKALQLVGYEPISLSKAP